MKVRAKFQVQSVEQFQYGSKVKLGAIYGTQGENKDFTDATPSGTIEMMISPGRPAADAFKPGAQFYLDFIPVEDEALVTA